MILDTTSNAENERGRIRQVAPPKERLLFPPTGRKSLVSARLEKRPVVWAQLREMALAHEKVSNQPPPPPPKSAGVAEAAAPQRPALFQCRLINFTLLVEALQLLLPRDFRGSRLSSTTCLTHGFVRSGE